MADIITNRPEKTPTEKTPTAKAPTAKILTAEKSSSLSGTALIPGDKSISHRALMLGALTAGESRVFNLLESDDVMATRLALAKCGVDIRRKSAGEFIINGRGVGGLCAPGDILDMGNSGTSARLLTGILAAHPFLSIMTGDASLRRRPMRRVTTPLEKLGPSFSVSPQGRLPMAIRGRDFCLPPDMELETPSAQIKSALLFFGLHAPGTTRIIEKTQTRDHSEIMLRHFGANLTTRPMKNGENLIELEGQPELSPQSVSVPGDISSAAFIIAATCLVPGSKVTLPSVGLNPQRTGLISVLREMGADIEEENGLSANGEYRADLHIRATPLKGVDVPPDEAASMIDEYPILAVLAARAEGTTRMNGIGELRVKESDRIETMARGLCACGIKVKQGQDWLEVTGSADKIQGGAVIDPDHDHRIAMSFLILGLVAEKPVHISDGSSIETSFPDFLQTMKKLGAPFHADYHRD